MIENKLLSIDNGIDKEVKADATLIAKEYYTSYAQYVLEYRALPSVYDGLKPVQRRIIYTANQFPQKLMKTTKLAGSVLQYHPHSSDAIEGAINTMAHPLNVFPMFTTKGNFGGVNFSAAAGRYTELYLSEIARQNFCQFIDYADYEIGEIGELEPEALPCLIPYSMFAGADGIGIGLATKIMPLNLLDIIDYYIEYIKKGFSKKLILPDVGHILLEMTDKEIRDATKDYKGQIKCVSIINQISSNTVLIESLYDRSIDSIINKIDKRYGWFKDDKIGFRDMSTDSAKYVFEIYDPSISIQTLIDVLKEATRRSGTYTRIVEENGAAIFSSLDYAVKQSLAYLNKAIDKKIKFELAQFQKQLDLYTVLELCKNKKVFNKATTLTQEQLVDLIIQTSNCSQEIANEIIKKPISYLTTSHDKEINDLKNKVDELNNHNRTSYLIRLYKEFRKAVLPFYEQKKHTISQNSLLKDPRVKLESGIVSITEGDGLEFDSEVFFITDQGSIYKYPLSKDSAYSPILDTNGEIIVGIVSDKSKYIKVLTRSKSKKYEGDSIIPISEISVSKKYINLRDEDNEKIVLVEGGDRIPKGRSSALKGSRLAKTTTRYI